MAKPVTVTLTHEHSKEEAKRRLDENIGNLTSQLGSIAKVQTEWKEDTLHFTARAMMQAVTGEVTVFPQHVRITVMLPNILAGMAEKVSRNIEKEGALLLEKK